MEYTKLRTTFGIIFGPSLDPNRVPIFIELRAQSQSHGNYYRLPSINTPDRYDKLDEDFSGGRSSDNRVTSDIRRHSHVPSVTPPDLLMIDLKPRQEQCTDLIVFGPQLSDADPSSFGTDLTLQPNQAEPNANNYSVNGISSNGTPWHQDIGFSHYNNNSQQYNGNYPVSPFYNNHGTNFNPISELMEPVTVHANFRHCPSSPMTKDGAQYVRSNRFATYGFKHQQLSLYDE